MLLFYVGFVLLALAHLGQATTHRLIISTLGSYYLYTVEFDDEDLTLKHYTTFKTSGSSSWISLSHDKKNLYGTYWPQDNSSAGYISYGIENNGETLRPGKNLKIDSKCASSRGIYIIAETKPPYAVYGAPFGAPAQCGTVMSVDGTGALAQVIQHFNYDNNSGVHGMALDAKNEYLYSADDTGNMIWTHKIDEATGKLTFHDKINASSAGADPRHVVVHPSGEYLYTVLEAANKLAVYAIDPITHKPKFQELHSTVPEGSNSSLWWSAEVALSASGKYIWATARAHDTTNVGYITTFELAENGKVLRRNFILPTTIKGGNANQISPSDFSDRWAARLDIARDGTGGVVEIWDVAEDHKSAKVVASVRIKDEKCCTNAAWIS